MLKINRIYAYPQENIHMEPTGGLGTSPCRAGASKWVEHMAKKWRSLMGSHGYRSGPSAAGRFFFFKDFDVSWMSCFFHPRLLLLAVQKMMATGPLFWSENHDPFKNSIFRAKPLTYPLRVSIKGSKTFYPWRNMPIFTGPIEDVGIS